MEKHFFEKTNPVKLFFMATIPGAISMLAASAYLLIDGILVGRLLGEECFAALNLAMPYVNICFAISDMIGVGSSVVIAIEIGKKQEKEANSVFTASILIIEISAVVTGVIMYLLAPVLLSFSGAEGNLSRLAIRYLRIFAVCGPVTTIIYAMDNFLKDCGKIRFSLVLNLIFALSCGVFEYILIKYTDMGLDGSAYGYTLGAFVIILIFFTPFVLGKMPLKFASPAYGFKMAYRIFANGFSIFLNSMASQIPAIIINTILVGLGGARAVSVYGMLLIIDSVAQPLMYGTTDAIQPAVSYNWGAGNMDRVRKLEKITYIVLVMLGAVFACVCFFFPNVIASMFADNEGVLTLAVTAIPLFGLGYLMRWLSFATVGFMLSIEASGGAILISFCEALFFPILSLVLLRGLGLNGIWLNFTSSAFLTGIMCIFFTAKTLKYVKSTELSSRV